MEEYPVRIREVASSRLATPTKHDRRHRCSRLHPGAPLRRSEFDSRVPLHGGLAVVCTAGCEPAHWVRFPGSPQPGHVEVWRPGPAVDRSATSSILVRGARPARDSSAAEEQRDEPPGFHPGLSGFESHLLCQACNGPTGGFQFREPAGSPPPRTPGNRKRGDSPRTDAAVIRYLPWSRLKLRDSRRSSFAALAYVVMAPD